MKFHRGVENQAIWPGDGTDSGLSTLYPRYDRSVIEANDEFHSHPYAATLPDDNAHNISPVVARRHAIDNGDRTVLGLVIGFQNERVAAISALDFRGLLSRAEQPAAVVRSSQKRRETGGRIEPRKAQPVDRAIQADQRGGLAIADHRILFNR